MDVPVTNVQRHHKPRIWVAPFHTSRTTVEATAFRSTRVLHADAWIAPGNAPAAAADDMRCGVGAVLGLLKVQKLQEERGRHRL
jgi:hypothetical protein